MFGSRRKSNEAHWRAVSKGSLKAPEPSLGDKITNYFSSGLQSLGVDGRDAQRLGKKLFGVIENLTPVGNATMAEQGVRRARKGGAKNVAVGSALTALAALPIPAPAKKAAKGMFAKGIRAWHGSPHDFDKFDINKIGTGEGAQGQGHGLYFASDKPSAQWYADTYGGGSGKLYETQINADPRDMLDWNINLGDMHPAVKERVRAVIPDAPWDESGMALYARAKQLYGSDEAASRALRKAGVPGVRYQGQRGVNYTVFDDNLIDIRGKH